MTPADASLAHDRDAIDDEPSDDLCARVKSELGPGERLLWSGRAVARPEPISGGFLTGVVIAGVISALCVAALLEVFRVTAWGVGREALPLLSALTVIDVFLIWALVAIRLVKRSQRVKLAGTLYALTDRRAIIWSPEPAPGVFKVESFPRGRVSAVYRLERPDGSGDVVFGQRADGPPHEAPSPVGFFGVAEVRRVEEQVRRTLVLPPGASAPDGRSVHEREHMAGGDV